MFHLQIDDREKVNRGLFDHLSGKRLSSVEVKRLTIGDYGIFYNGKLLIIIERKTWDDLAASIKDNRLDEQIQNMLKVQADSKVAVFILIEGNLRKEHAHIPQANLIAKLDHVVIRYQSIHILYALTEEAMVSRIFALMDNYPYELLPKSDEVKEVKDVKTEAEIKGGDLKILMAPKEISIASIAVNALCAVKGIQVATAQALLTGRTLRQVLQISSGEIALCVSPVSGQLIGEKRAVQIAKRLQEPETICKMLAEINGITKANAPKILEHAPMDKWAMETLANIKLGKRSLGPVIAQRVLDVLAYKR